jgi:hypothetical protein
MRLIANVIYLTLVKKVVTKIKTASKQDKAASENADENQDPFAKISENKDQKNTNNAKDNILKEDEEKTKPKPKEKKLRKILEMMIRMVVSLDHLNIVANLLFIGTSISVGVTWFDYCMIWIDLILLFYFQFELYYIFSRYKNALTKNVSQIKHMNILLSAFYMQNGNGLKMPATFILNAIQFTRLCLIFMFYRYERAFGFTFVGLNIAILVVLVYHAYHTYRSFLKIYWVFLTVLAIESILFMLLGLVAIFPDILRPSTQFSNVLTWILLGWMAMSTVLAILMIIMPSHAKLYKNAKGYKKNSQI